jgi:hypothetical protein
MGLACPLGRCYSVTCLSRILGFAALLLTSGFLGLLDAQQQIRAIKPAGRLLLNLRMPIPLPPAVLAFPLAVALARCAQIENLRINGHG